MPKFKIGDKVYVRRDVETGVEKGAVDFDKAYKIIGQWWNDAYKLDGLDIYGFSADWLLPAKCEVKFNLGDKIKDVKFSGPATIVFWTDGTKTVVKCRKGDKFDPEKGIAMACAKKLLGNEDGYHKVIEKYLTKGKTTSGGIESMDTEEIRRAVREGCDLFDRDECHTKCPCHIDSICFTICVASRDQLIKMLKSFEKAGYFSYDDWRMHHA